MVSIKDNIWRYNISIDEGSNDKHLIKDAKNIYNDNNTFWAKGHVVANAKQTVRINALELLEDVKTFLLYLKENNPIIKVFHVVKE